MAILVDDNLSSFDRQAWNDLYKRLPLSVRETKREVAWFARKSVVTSPTVIRWLDPRQLDRVPIPSYSVDNMRYATAPWLSIRNIVPMLLTGQVESSSDMHELGAREGTYRDILDPELFRVVARALDFMGYATGDEWSNLSWYKLRINREGVTDEGTGARALWFRLAVQWKSIGSPTEDEIKREHAEADTSKAGIAIRKIREEDY